MNILLNSIGRKTYMIEYFKNALNKAGKIFASNSVMTYPLTQADGYLITPQIYDDSYILELINFCRLNHINWLIPLSDSELPILAKNREKFAEHNISVIVSDLSAIEIFNDKWESYQFLSSLGLPQPKTYIDFELAKREIKSENLNFPLILKPRWSNADHINIVEIETIEELNVFYPKMLREIVQSGLHNQSKEENIIIQEIIEGVGYNLDIFNDLTGSYITTVAKQKIASNGTAVKITDNKPFGNIVKLITNRLHPVAAISIDCIVTETGGVVVSKMHGRLGSQYPFAHLAGIDFPKQMVEWFNGLPTSDINFSYDLNVTGYINQTPAKHFNHHSKVQGKLNLLITTVQRRAYLVKYFKDALENSGKLFAGNSVMTGALQEADEYVLTPRIYSESYIDFLIKYCQEKQISAILSWSDVDIPVLAKNKERFKGHGITLLVSDSHAIDTCNDKWKAYQFLSSLGLSQPKTYIDLDLLKNDIQSGKISFPVIIKPRWGWDSIGIYEATTSEELNVLYQKSYKELLNSPFRYEAQAYKNNCVIIQEKIEGEEYGLNLLNDLNGNYVTVVARLKLSMDERIGYMGQIIDNKLFKNICKTISSHLKHILFMDIDCILTSTGEIVVLDLNPRFGDQYTYAHLAGANFPKQIVEWLMGASTSESNITVKAGVTGIKDEPVPVCNRN